ncbi:MAG: hypothetical protein Q9M39_09780 [Sulfurovum sp.]|nr:hypothetical protein [Sulfurovum sp.]
MQVQLNINNNQKNLFLDFIHTFMKNDIVTDYIILDEKNDKKFQTKDEELSFYSKEFEEMATELKELSSK